MRRSYAIVLLIAFLVLMSACSLLTNVRPATPTAGQPTATPPKSTALPATATAAPPTATVSLATSTPVATEAPATATPPITPVAKPSPEPRIVLRQVSAAESMPGIVHVVGKAQVFEATLAVELLGPGGEVIARGVTMASTGAPEWGDFEIDFYYPPPANPVKATLRAYEPSPKDGSPNSLVEAPVVLAPAPDLVAWKTFSNPSYNFEVRYPPSWHVNQGSVVPAPPQGTKLSTYQVRTPGELLGEREAEIWITVSDLPSLAEMENLRQKGYKETSVVVGGRQAVRFTAAQPVHGVYDVVYTLSGKWQYRVQLSAATHDFDSTFALVLATFNVSE